MTLLQAAASGSFEWQGSWSQSLEHSAKLLLVSGLHPEGPEPSGSHPLSSWRPETMSYSLLCTQTRFQYTALTQLTWVKFPQGRGRGPVSGSKRNGGGSYSKAHLSLAENFPSLVDSQNASCHDSNADGQGSQEESRAGRPSLPGSIPWEREREWGTRDRAPGLLVPWLVGFCTSNLSILPINQGSQKQPAILNHHWNPITSPCWLLFQSIHWMAQHNCLSPQTPSLMVPGSPAARGEVVYHLVMGGDMRHSSFQPSTSHLPRTTFPVHTLIFHQGHHYCPSDPGVRFRVFYWFTQILTQLCAKPWSCPLAPCLVSACIVSSIKKAL